MYSMYQSGIVRGKRAEEDALPDVISKMEFNMKNHSSGLMQRKRRAIEKVKGYV